MLTHPRFAPPVTKQFIVWVLVSALLSAGWWSQLHHLAHGGHGHPGLSVSEQASICCGDEVRGEGFLDHAPDSLECWVLDQLGDHGPGVAVPSLPPLLLAVAPRTTRFCSAVYRWNAAFFEARAPPHLLRTFD